MTNVAVLDNISHQQLKVSEGFKLQAQDGLGCLQIFPSELDAVHKEFPIFIRKDANTGQFFLAALTATSSAENSFFQNDRWHSRYVPIMARRGPFLMSKTKDSDVIQMCIDLDDKRVCLDGDRLFDDEGNLTPTTKRAATILNLIHQGYQQTQDLLSALAEFHLVEALAVNTPLPENQADMLVGLYSVNADKIKALDAATLATLNASGHLQLAYFISSSASNLLAMIDAKRMQSSRKEA